jgi:limonene-1,2-epoxide hydrolase
LHITQIDGTPLANPLEVVDLAVNGNIVLTERVDRTPMRQQDTAWRDYFDVP